MLIVPRGIRRVQHNDPAASQSSDASESDDRSRIEYGITLRTISPKGALTMIYNIERKEILNQFLKLEWRQTVVMFIRAIPSMVAWIGLLIWLFM